MSAPCKRYGHPVMDIETGLCTECGEPMDCPPILDFGVTGVPAPTPAHSDLSDHQQGRAVRSVARPLALLLAVVLAGFGVACGTLPTAPTTCATCATAPESGARVSASGKILCELVLSVDTKVDRTARGVWLKAQLTEMDRGGCGDLEVDGYPDWTLSVGENPVWHAYHTLADAQANNVAGDARGKYMHLLGPQGEYLIRSRASVGGGRDFMLCMLDEAGAECHRVNGAGNPL